MTLPQILSTIRRWKLICIVYEVSVLTLKTRCLIGVLNKKSSLYTGGAKKCIHILRDVICVLLFEAVLNYGSNV
jgi:hypothetical protein